MSILSGVGAGFSALWRSAPRGATGTGTVNAPTGVGGAAAAAGRGRRRRAGRRGPLGAAGGRVCVGRSLLRPRGSGEGIHGPFAIRQHRRAHVASRARLLCRRRWPLASAGPYYGFPKQVELVACRMPCESQCTRSVRIGAIGRPPLGSVPGG
ncbi:MAG: hypothetical protein AVDCRST_MAG49-4536 [uncultured Thermomicrobiales bacterium]|uniref:Uncharacterized protein n=1 Tax=uncultured Thermomicrobiales bacterium TaxID=1645740 RepID=A0A6J4VGE9_9BACT|nr:MAG: hypothetical protein AVDCRST_MAG49-4536 [uncultured Thermomicrobiales bacterium]